MAKPTEGEGEVGGLEDRLKAENRRRRSQLVVPALRAEAAGVEGRAASEGETCNLGSRKVERGNFPEHPRNKLLQAGSGDLRVMGRK